MIRIAIIGTGNIANAHMRAFLRQQGRCEVAALCDLVPGKAEQMKAQYGRLSGGMRRHAEGQG